MRILRAVLTIFFTYLAVSSYGQIADPTTWNYDVKKTGEHQYELVFHLSLEEGWHIWALQPGGDGFEIAPSFTFDKNTNVQLKGKVREAGKAITANFPGIDGKLTYYTGKVDYIQTVVVKGKTKITGTHQYQVCNDQLCLPPKDKSFAVEIN